MDSSDDAPGNGTDVCIERAAADRGRVLASLRIRYPDAVAERGFRPLHPRTGDPYIGERRHLVATCRSIVNFAIGALVDGPDWCLDAVEHGLRFLNGTHRGDDGGYHLVVDADGSPIDRTRSAYGHAFVLLAYARAADAGIEDAEDEVRAVHGLIEERFRDAAGLLRGDCDPGWSEREAYRGQNANMHACEAYLAAYEATGDGAYLERARHIAGTITVELAAGTGGRLWEHYTEEWNHDFTYNEAEPRHRFRPPGYQPGHHAEWARLLALLDRYGAATFETEGESVGWYDRGHELFETAVDLGWAGNGFVYTHEADGTPLVADRYGWALAEAIGASAALSERALANGDGDEAQYFERWNQRFEARTELYRGPAGVWHEKRAAPADGGEAVSPDPPGVEPDYHPVGARYEGYRSTLERSRRR